MSVPHVASTITRPLCLGSSGESVRTLQNLLNGSQLAVGPKLLVDGRFGKMTQIALIAFQRRKGLRADGVVGPKTAHALGMVYRPVDERPYTISYDKPSLPAATPPMAVIAEAIHAGMDKFKERIGDDFWMAFSDPNNDPYYQRLMARVFADNPSISKQQFSQRILRIQDLVFRYNLFLKNLADLVVLSVTDPHRVPIGLRDAFKEFISQMNTACNNLSFVYGVTDGCRKRLKEFPYDSLVSHVEALLSGERSVDFAAAGIRMVFQSLDDIDVFNDRKPVDRPSLDWIKNFQFQHQI